MSVAALYLAAPSSDPVECSVRTWLKTDQMADIEGFAGGASMATPEDRIRFHLPDFSAPLRIRAVVSIEAGEAYRIDHLYPVDDQYQTARVNRLTAAEATGLPVPE